MTNKKLQQVGEELGVSKKDMAQMRRQRLKARLFFPVLGAIIVAFFTGLGYVAREDGLGPGYPYATPGLALLTGPQERKGGFRSFIFILSTIILSAIGFLAADKLGNHHGAAPAYHVFSRQR